MGQRKLGQKNATTNPHSPGTMEEPPAVNRFAMECSGERTLAYIPKPIFLLAFQQFRYFDFTELGI